MIRDLLNGDCSLEKALIVASGVRNEKAIGDFEKARILKMNGPNGTF